jgi:hypothetical protein
LDRDGDNDFDDFRIFKSDYATAMAAAAAAQTAPAVPEPASLPLQMLLFGAFVVRRASRTWRYNGRP